MPPPFYWTVKICYHSTRFCNRLKFQSMNTFVPVIQNTLLDFWSVNRRTVPSRKPHTLSRAAPLLYLESEKVCKQGRDNQPALIKILQQVSPICVNKVYSLVKYHTKLWGCSSKQKETCLHSDKDMLVCLRGCKEFLLILLSDHCKSDTLFYQKNLNFLITSSSLTASKSNLGYSQYSKCRFLEVLRSYSNKNSSSLKLLQRAYNNCFLVSLMLGIFVFNFCLPFHPPLTE